VVLAVLAFNPAAFAASPDELRFYNYAPLGGVGERSGEPFVEPRDGSFGSNANSLPPGVPLPPGAQFSPNSQGDASSSSPTAGPAPSESLPLPSGAQSEQSDWSIVNSPNSIPTRASNFHSGVACVSASECWAVGYYTNGSADQTLIERWDGAVWTVVSSPNTSATQHNRLNGVTCVSASECWAVGYSSDIVSGVAQTLIERWDGAVWTVVSSPNTSATQTNVLNGLSCTSASDCWAVGYHTGGSVLQTLIERWDGNSWAIFTSPNTSATQANLLTGVMCTSASDCWAVGRGGASQTLMERWDGSSWAIVSSPNPIGSLYSSLSGVTCVSASDCWAVGYYLNGITQQSLMERWDGSSWTVVILPNTLTLITQKNVLSGVTCVSASDCWAVGYYNTGDPLQNGINQTLIERWDGSSWAIVSAPNASTEQHNSLSGVTCVSASDCWAVGADSEINGGIAQTLIERWDGSSWAIVGSPNTSTAQGNALQNMTCVSASDCWAVGYYTTVGGVLQTLIERWDGTSWAIVGSPNTSAAQNNILYGVTCASASDCWAVGYRYTGSTWRTLIERWDGTSWTIVTSPNTSASQHNYLFGVTCVSASDCWAVGHYNVDGVNQTLIERWDGAVWTVVSSPNTSAAQNNRLTGLSCVSASDCWAVGFYRVGSIGQTLIERWDGTSWSLVGSPNTSSTEANYLYGVTCVSASDCWAVGYYQRGTDPAPTLIERWDGTSWAIVSSPSTSSTQNNLLAAVTCVSASDCWAVGYYDNGGFLFQTLIEHWDGTAWAIVNSPNTNTAQSNYLLGVTCVSASDCWAAGWYSSGQTLVLRYTGEHAAEPAADRALDAELDQRRNPADGRLRHRRLELQGSRWPADPPD
jgi:hypothetical protein